MVISRLRSVSSQNNNINCNNLNMEKLNCECWSWFQKFVDWKYHRRYYLVRQNSKRVFEL